MSETLTHGATLARRFYDEYQTLFATAMAATNVADKCFTVAASEFDEWLVAQSILEQPASAFDSNTIHRRGAVMRRNEIRQRMNSAALKAENFPAYTIGPAKNNNLKVRLIVLYAQEAPEEIAARVRTSTAHHQRVIKNSIRILNKSALVREEDRVAMGAFSRFMIPMLDGFSSGMTAALRGAQHAKRRKRSP
jgi:hypothetical protein